MTPIRTERLTLRAIVADDAEAITRQIGDFEVSGNLARVPHPYGLADARSWIEGLHAPGAPATRALAIDIPRHGLVGVIGFDRNARAEPVLGYWLGRPHWGQGLMTEAASALCAWCFAATDADRVLSGVFHFNAASLAVQRKLGFVEIGRRTMFNRARGEELEHIDTELTPARFERLRAEGGKAR